MRRGWVQRLRAVALGATVLALLAGGVVAGWFARDRFGEHTSLVTVQRPLTIVRERSTAAGTIPNVLGLSRDGARQVLGDAGFDLAQVSVKTQPYAGEPGVVIGQDPAPGETSSAVTTLTVAEPGTTPKLNGLVLDDARRRLSALGATVTIRSRYDAGATVGSVLQTDPAAGQPLANRVELVVAEPPSSVFLSDLSAVNSSCNSDSVYVGGVERTHSLVCQPGEGSPSEISYVLNRRVDELKALVGIADRSGTDTPVVFQMFVDGRLIGRYPVTFGKTVQVAVPVSGALRLRIVVASGKPGPSGTQVEAVVGDGRLVGGTSAIDALTAEARP